MRYETDQKVKIAQSKTKLGKRARPSFVPKVLSEEQVAVLAKASHQKAVEGLLAGARVRTNPRAVDHRLDQNPVVKAAMRIAAQAQVPKASAEANPLLAWADQQNENSRNTRGVR